MTKIPNVDWVQLQEDGPIHKTDARQDNMREVRNQFHGCHANAGVEAMGQGPCAEPASRLSLGAQAPGVVGDPGTGNPHFTVHPPCQCPYGWHAIHTDCHPAPFWPAEPVPPYGVDEYGQKLCKCGHPYGWHAHRGACGGSCGCDEYDDGTGALQARDAKRAGTGSGINDGKLSCGLGVGQSMFSPEEIAHWRAEALKLYQESMHEVQAANERRCLAGDTEISDEEIEF